VSTRSRLAVSHLKKTAVSNYGAKPIRRGQEHAMCRSSDSGDKQ
jgi:hypothetical protein